MLHVLRVDIGHNRNRCRQAVERAVALVGFNNHPLAFARAGIRAIGVDDPAIHNRRVKLAVVQKSSDHCRGRCLAMRTRHRDVGFEPHQLGQHLGTAHNRQPFQARFVKLWVAWLDR